METPSPTITTSTRTHSIKISTEKDAGPEQATGPEPDTLPESLLDWLAQIKPDLGPGDPLLPSEVQFIERTIE